MSKSDDTTPSNSELMRLAAAFIVARLDSDYAEMDKIWKHLSNEDHLDFALALAALAGSESEVLFGSEQARTYYLDIVNQATLIHETRLTEADYSALLETPNSPNS